MTRTALPLPGLLLAALLSATSAHAAEPIRLGITTILSGPFADRGQSEQYGAQLAIDRINQSGGVLGRPVEAFYADNACNPAIGVPNVRRLVEQEHVPVVIGALCTPVTHAIMPILQQAQIPLIIATSAGQDFVDASGVGGDPYAFKTIASEVDIARALIGSLAARHVTSVAIVVDPGGFQHSNAVAFAKAAEEAGLHVTANETLAAGTNDFPALIARLKTGSPGALLTMFGPSTAGFFRAWEQAGWTIPISGRIDIATALAAVSPEFRTTGLADLTSISSFSPAIPAVAEFVAAYRAHTGLTPTQRSFYVYEATYLAVDAIRRAGSDQPAAIEQALKTTTMASMLGGTYTMDDHNHPHIPLTLLGVRDGKPAVVATIAR
jgi:branched-chain amino acid transport system substrate-binding protein